MTRYIAITREQLIEMAELLENGASLEDLIRAYPMVNPDSLGDLVAGWE